MGYHNLYDLDVWKEARNFKRRIYEVVKGFPASERFDLSNQLIRAVRSILANLAEGHGRQTLKDELRFCIMARGSWSECLNHLIDAKDCGFISIEQLANLKQDWDKLGRILNGYINYLRSRIKPANPESSVSESAIDYSAARKLTPDAAENDDKSFLKIIGA